MPEGHLHRAIGEQSQRPPQVLIFLSNYGASCFVLQVRTGFLPWVWYNPASARCAGQSNVSLLLLLHWCSRLWRKSNPYIHPFQQDWFHIYNGSRWRTVSQRSFDWQEVSPVWAWRHGVPYPTNEVCRRRADSLLHLCWMQVSGERRLLIKAVHLWKIPPFLIEG